MWKTIVIVGPIVEKSVQNAIEKAKITSIP